jgi:hypothetical protein
MRISCGQLKFFGSDTCPRHPLSRSGVRPALGSALHTLPLQISAWAAAGSELPPGIFDVQVALPPWLNATSLWVIALEFSQERR